MKHLARMAMVLLGCAVCALLFSALVQTAPNPLAAAAEMPPGDTLPRAGILMQRCVMPAEPTVPHLPQAASQRQQTAAIETQGENVPQAGLCRDGNGWVLTGRTWSRTVYAVCPPEGVPG